MSHESTVPNMQRPSATAFLTSGTFSMSQLIFSALKYVAMGIPTLSRNSFSVFDLVFLMYFAAVETVRVSSQTIALCSGSPVVLSQRMVVSLWLVIPMALTVASPTFFSSLTATFLRHLLGDSDVKIKASLCLCRGINSDSTYDCS